MEAKASGSGEGDDTSVFDKSLADEGQVELSPLLTRREGLAEPRETLQKFRQALDRIRAVCAEHMEDGPPTIGALQQLVGRLFQLVDRVYLVVEGAIVKLDPNESRETTLEIPSEGMDPALPNGREVPGGREATSLAFTSVEAAAAALAAAVAYFQRSEPSNPALLLLRQAQALIGKSFLEAMQLLVPEHVAKASIDMGSGRSFSLPLSRIAEVSVPVPEARLADATGELDRVVRVPSVSTRGEAVAVLEQVGTYFRVAEPSSPIPMLTDRACALTGKDFMALLGDLLPPGALPSGKGAKT
jgi:predicted component of type VI protein secretion system